MGDIANEPAGKPRLGWRDSSLSLPCPPFFFHFTCQHLIGSDGHLRRGGVKILDGVGMALALTTDEVVLGPDLDLQVVDRPTDRFFEDTNVQETKKSIWVLCFFVPVVTCLSRTR